MKHVPQSETIVWDNLGLESLPTSLIVTGVLLEILFIFNLIAICSSDKKCRMLKKVLGSLYCIMGIVIVIVAHVKGENLGSIADPTSDAATNPCNNLQKYSQGFVVGLGVKYSAVQAVSYNNCMGGKLIWENDFISLGQS